MIKYFLNRKEDIHGVSGTGKVAEVVQFSNGLVAVAWLGSFPTVEIHPSLASVVRVHGHGGKTLLEFDK